MTSNTITWGSWQAVPNLTSIAASASTFRVTGAAVAGYVANQTVANTAGQAVISILPAAVTAGVSTLTIDQIMNGVEVAKSATNFNVVANGIWAPCAQVVHGYIAVNSAGNLAFYDNVAPVFTIFFCNLSAQTVSANIFGVINYEVTVTNGNTTILEDSPATIDLEDLQRGVRKAANTELVFFTDSVLMGEVDIGMMPTQVAPSPVGPPQEFVGTSTNPGTQVYRGRIDEEPSFIEQVADASEQLNRIVTNTVRSATAAAPVIGAAVLAANAVRSGSQPRLQ